MKQKIIVMKIKQAMLKFELESGKPMNYSILGPLLWPDMDKNQAQIKISRIARGKAKLIEPDLPLKISLLLNCTLNYLYDVG